MERLAARRQARITVSRGVRLPKAVIDQVGLVDEVEMQVEVQVEANP